MGFFKQKISYLELLYQNIKVLQEISKARKKKILMKNFTSKGESITFEDLRLKAVFELYCNRFKNRELEPLIAFLIKDMERYRFEESSSVPQKFEPQYTTYQNRYDKLREINLLSHTVRVFIVACEEKREMPDKFMEQIALLALSHDFGKNNKIIEIASEGKQDKHNQISAKYLGLVMRNMGGFNEDFIDAMCGALYFHHAQNTEKEMGGSAYTNSFIDMLNFCDAKARDHELRAINKKSFAKKVESLGSSAQ